MTETSRDITIKRLSPEETGRIYQEHLRRDFPDNERKPYFIIRQEMEKGAYETYGAYIKEQLAAYAFICCEEENGVTAALLDYFAVCSGLRGKGIGGKVLRKLHEETLDEDYILIESESPDKAFSDADRLIRERRIAFYERCGAYHSTVRTKLYQVDYDMLAFVKEGMDRSELALYERTDWMYRRIYPRLRPDWKIVLYMDETKEQDAGNPG